MSATDPHQLIKRSGAMLNRSNEIGSTNVTFFCIYLISFKDISECDEETLATHHNSYAHICHADANCTNTKGSFYCTCHTGYSGDGFICTGINKTHALCRLLWYLLANLNIIIAFFTVFRCKRVFTRSVICWIPGSFAQLSPWCQLYQYQRFFLLYVSYRLFW